MYIMCVFSVSFFAYFISKIQCSPSTTLYYERISKGQGYQGFLSIVKEKGREQFWPKRQFASYKEKLEKWTEFHYF
jgi:hypothetical protein